MNTIECFTDASYSPQKNICYIGYKIGNNDIVCESIGNIKNTPAELHVIDKCIDIYNTYYSLRYRSITIYTDCQKATQVNYPSFVKIVKVKGHQKNRLNYIEKTFSSVDKAVRKSLRNFLKDH